MKKIKVVWTETAVKDLDDIIEYISIDSINNAIEQYEKIKKAAIELNDFPKSGRIVPELNEQNIIKYRELIVSPWRIMYKQDRNIVYVMAIIDGRRNIEDILLRKNIR